MKPFPIKNNKDKQVRVNKGNSFVPRVQKDRNWVKPINLSCLAVRRDQNIFLVHNLEQECVLGSAESGR